MKAVALLTIILVATAGDCSAEGGRDFNYQDISDKASTIVVATFVRCEEIKGEAIEPRIAKHYVLMKSEFKVDISIKGKEKLDASIFVVHYAPKGKFAVQGIGAVQFTKLRFLETSDGKQGVFIKYLLFLRKENGEKPKFGESYLPSLGIEFVDMCSMESFNAGEPLEIKK